MILWALLYFIFTLTITLVGIRSLSTFWKKLDEACKDHFEWNSIRATWSSPHSLMALFGHDIEVMSESHEHLRYGRCISLALISFSMVLISFGTLATVVGAVVLILE